LHLDVVGLPGSITRQLFDRPAALPRDASLDGVASRLIEMKREQNASPIAAVCAAKALAFAALARCIESLEPATQGRLARFARSGSAIAPALRRIDSRFNQPLAVPELAELCCLSPDHFIRRFREAVGQTPGQYLAERRVAAAAELLLLTDQSIERIAARCGFSNRFYFSRVFAKHIGTPPATYRKSQRV
jgi:transcriptional regulator GlxA family with amidase domain